MGSAPLAAATEGGYRPQPLLAWAKACASDGRQEEHRDGAAASISDRNSRLHHAGPGLFKPAAWRLFPVGRTFQSILFGLPYLGHAGDAQTASLAGHFGIPLATGTNCPPTAPGLTELSGNLSMETGQSGWTGVFNATSKVTRVQPPGGSFDGSWALQVAPSSGNSGTAGVNNASPVWVPGPPGTASTAASTYAGSAFVRGSVPGEQISLLVREITPSGTGVGFHTTTMTLGDTAWHQVTSTYTAQASGDLIKYSLSASNLASSDEYFQADCLSLQTPTG
jgi:hypothetical protein